MTATLLEARLAIRDFVQDVDGIDTVTCYRPGTPSPPCAIVGWPPIWLPDQRLGGAENWTATIPVQVLVLMGTNDAADRTLSAFLEPTGTSSIVAKFDTDPTLAGVVGYAVVMSVTDIGVAQFSDDGIQYLAATFNIEVDSG